ncbi:DUF2062 domain-containing protein [Pikeienuella piscinae]|uniref:DUF2062 domain-containing protein n=1 Tax=Pikeienuella piscinae TaxID=2748098 RepID=A0A7L5C1N7_9RHOB|nr:DUF2062 domain-containing protein [Pikeienuella piscinae]QIE56396.1 DUF2062 domain-containing protein [Pikeienuella piscinae]
MIDYWRHRMQRLPDSPTRIALGVACGVYTSFTPFFGFHFIVAAGLAWLCRGNIFASAIGTFFGNPLTFPFIVAICLEVGGMIMGIPINSDFTGLGFHQMAVLLLQNVKSLVIPYFVGGLIPGLIAAVASYFIVRPLVATYQRRRRARLIARARARIAKEVKKEAGATE